MDECESEQAFQKFSAVETSRPPLGPAEKNNGTTRRTRTREITSRYRSPSPSAPSDARRCPSPTITRTVNKSSQLVPKRAISAERRRPSTPPSPTRPSTPVHDTSSSEMQLASKKIVGSRLPEHLWPSTMRSLSVSFQSDTFSLPISKREKPVSNPLSDRTLKPSSNVARKQAESPPISRKPTPERKRSPLKGKNTSDQSENSKPVDGVHARLVDQHRWPSRRKSIDLAEKTSKTPTLPRRMSMPDGTSKLLQKAASEVARLVPFDISDENPLQESVPPKRVSSSSLDRMTLMTPAIRSQSLPTPGLHPQLSKKTAVSTSVSRGVSPSRTRSLNSAPSRGVSPSRIRPSSPSRQSNSSSSVLSFIADIRKGKKGANHIEDVHQLRLLYNRHLQWRYANAQAHAAVYNQRITAQRTLYNVWRATSELWDSVTEKRVGLQQLRLELKLHSVLDEQVAYLDDWALIERDHTNSLSGAIEDLRPSTLRLPVTGGARADIESVKAAVCSAVDVMQAMGSSICSILSQVEGMNSLVSEVAALAAQERAMLDECKTLLAATASTQVEEYSLRTNLMQMKQDWKSG